MALHVMPITGFIFHHPFAFFVSTARAPVFAPGFSARPGVNGRDVYVLAAFDIADALLFSRPLSRKKDERIAFHFDLMQGRLRHSKIMLNGRLANLM
ncbi:MULTISPECIES: hypothetical protein [Heyndrickxia]|uniref:hypothetical protein n=2 Tax=Heyndrickxia TaxID=2837504 RepID=UPI0012DAFD6F|nr:MULTISPECIES: hypothetical protein [Heyndrickxia]MEC2224928.1 hypothetical protein [Weizmannia sp. CD-2023]MED4322048.1 hypothetical protein [Weizmannia sp. CD-2023]MED4868075.1 hypothetical protein [Weizmannia sp. CD-2023]MED4901233.1 hypothetical protein [Weizmannia sp. CD-2023]NMH82820.1 hypothetical protein [Heyndrickxia coagulans]